MAVKKAQSARDKYHVPVSKRTSIGSGTPLNKSKRAGWKKYRGQGRP
jgi:hypothetical protein